MLYRTVARWGSSPWRHYGVVRSKTASGAAVYLTNRQGGWQADAKFFLQLLVTPLRRVDSGVVVGGGPVFHCPVMAITCPSRSGELRAVVRDDGAWVAEPRKHFSLQQLGDGGGAGGWQLRRLHPTRANQYVLVPTPR